VLHILEDMRWATVHLTEGNGEVSTKEESDLQEIEKTVVAATFEEYQQQVALSAGKEALCLG
jgi:hypothetical protein